MPGTLTALTMRAGANGEQTFARSAPLYVDARDLAATTNETHTVPAGADYVIFSADGDFYHILHGVKLAGGEDKILRGGVAECQPHAADVIRRVSPVALRVRIPQQEFVLVAHLDRSGRAESDAELL